MRDFWLQANRVLRGSPTLAPTAGLWGALLQLAGFTFLFGFLYGAVMGTFGGLFGERLWQVLFSALKVPLLLLATFVMAMPSFFVLNTLLGVRADFPEALRALLSSQAGLAIVLISLAPFTVLWYASSGNYNEAILFNGFMFGVASFTAHGLLRRSYRPLLKRNPRHRTLLRCWLALYVFVGIQMAWILRPFVGDPSQPTQFFRKDSWGNAYVVVVQMILSLFLK